MYIEDYGKPRELLVDEAEALSVKVQCSGLPRPNEYEAHLMSAGFSDVTMDDVTSEWTDFTATRYAMFRAARPRNIEVHGASIVDGLDDFYGTVAQLFQAGAVAGLKIVAR